MNKDLIPRGLYCYEFDITKKDEEREDFSIPICSCPYSTYKNINGVDVDWCEYKNKGGVSNYVTEEEHAKLVEHFGSVDAIYDNLPLDLLWDGVKECGENYGDFDEPKTEEEIVEWIKKVREYESQNNKS